MVSWWEVLKPISVLLEWLLKRLTRMREAKSHQELQKVKKRAVIVLSRFLTRGQDLAQRFAIGYGPTREQIDMRAIEDTVQWAEEAEIYLGKMPFLGPGYVARFRQGGLFPQGPVSFEAGRLSSYRADWESAIRQRCDNLERFILELSAGAGAGV